MSISLDSPAACQQELQRVANGIAELTVENTQLLESLEQLEEMWEMVEAAAFNAVDADKGATAAQVKAQALEALGKNEKTAELRKNVRAKRVELTAIERRLRSLEKRGGLAQSALKAHENESRNAGYHS